MRLRWIRERTCLLTLTLTLGGGLPACSSASVQTTPRGESRALFSAAAGSGEVGEEVDEGVDEVDGLAERGGGQPPVTLTYLANEGVMLRQGATVVVIDGVHRFYGEPYDVLPEAEQERLESGQGDYAEIDMLLATHRHGDHVHPEAVLRHLRANSSATFVAAEQVTRELAALPGAEDVTARVRGVGWRVGASETLELGGVRVELLGLRHAGERHASVASLGVVVTLGEVRVAHFGDAEGSAENLAPFGLAKRRLTGAVVPAWWVLDGDSREVIREQIAPETLFLAHVDATDPEAPARLAEAWPGAIVLHEKLTQHRLVAVGAPADPD